MTESPSSGSLHSPVIPLGPIPVSPGFPPVPDPLYLRLKDEIEGMGLVATSWLECIGQHTYTTQLREEIAEFQLKMTLFLTYLENPVQASETPPGIGSAKEQIWQNLKDEYDVLKDMVDTMQKPPKRVRRTPFGDESPPLESQTIGSSSQRAPTSAPPPVSVEAEDTYGHQNTDEAVDDHHAQPHQCRGG